jgi:hypothetical protein
MSRLDGKVAFISDAARGINHRWAVGRVRHMG